MTTANSGSNSVPPTGISPNLLLLTGGLIISRAVYVAIRLGIPDLLANGPKTVDDLARLTTSHAPSLRRVLRLLAALSVFVAHEQDTFGLAPIGERFRTGVPGSIRDMALLTDAVGGLKPYDHLLDAVQGGKSAFEFAHGTGIFEFLSNHPEEAAAFNAAMAERTAALAPTVASTYDFGGAELIIDIGGSQGTMISAILTANPRMKGIVFDLPEVVAGAAARLAVAGVTSRCETRGGDFFRGVPREGDYYLMANVLHDWDDERAEAILRNCRTAMPPHAKVLVIERAIADDHTKSIPTLVTDINMMVLSGGMERTDNEYAKLFARVGLQLTRVLPVRAPYAIFEGAQNPP
jgi:O-methyltransferase domain